MLHASEAGSDLALYTWTATGTDSPELEAERAYARLDQALARLGMTPIQERVFGELQALASAAKGRERALAASGERWAVPATCVEGAPAGRAGLAGIHVLAVRAGSSRLLKREGALLGRVAETESARFVGLSDLGRALSPGRAAAPADEVQAIIDAAAALLEQEGFSFREVARTWFYLRDILGWYGPFNNARNAAFRGLGLLGSNGSDGIPASTGIGGRNLRAGAWCTLDLLAVRPRAGARFEMKRLEGGLQNDPTSYGAAFARGVSLTLAEERLVFVSGTASIDARGATVHVGDFEAQLRHTVDAVQAILESAGTRLADVCQATAFLKSPDDVAAYARLAESTGLAAIPVIAAVADVCRPELLFELEATALVRR